MPHEIRIAALPVCVFRCGLYWRLRLLSHPGDWREGGAGQLLPLPPTLETTLLSAAGRAGLARTDLVSRLALDGGGRRVRPVPGIGPRADRDRQGLPRARASAAGLLPAGTGRSAFRLVGLGDEGAAAQPPLVQSAGAAADVRGGDDGVAGERRLGRRAGAECASWRGCSVFPGLCTAFCGRAVRSSTR